MKKPTFKEQAAKVEARYGKTLGASKGKRPAPKASVKVTPRASIKKGLTGAKLRYKKEF